VARALARAGATVYCTGRSTEANRNAKELEVQGVAEEFEAFALAHRPETVESTVAAIAREGGKAFACVADHTDAEQVRRVVERIASEQGRLDVVVDSVWGGDELAQWGEPFAESDLDRALRLLDRALRSHVITARLCLPLLQASDRGLLVEVTDGAGLYFRGAVMYDLVKVALARFAFGLAEELRDGGPTVLSLTPGFLRSEAMLEHLGVGEENFRDGVSKDPHFAFSETPLYLGRAVVALATDPDVRRKAGATWSTWQLHDEYGFADGNGETPHWGEHIQGTEVGADQRASEARFVAACAESIPATK
jgi:NAD(P)-dependent dehydrogenase (short-subunit alcohol dehydrogenase family)